VDSFDDRNIEHIVTCALEATGEGLHGQDTEEKGRRGNTTSAIAQEAGDVMLMLAPLGFGHLLRVSVIAASCSLRHTLQTS